MWEKANTLRLSSVKCLLMLAVTRNLFHSRAFFPFQREWHNIYSHIDNNEKLFLFVFCLLLTNSTIAQEKQCFPTIPNIPKQCVIRETINTNKLIFIPTNVYRYFDAKTANLELSCYQLFSLCTHLETGWTDAVELIPSIFAFLTSILQYWKKKTDPTA